MSTKDIVLDAVLIEERASGVQEIVTLDNEGWSIRRLLDYPATVTDANRHLWHDGAPPPGEVATVYRVRVRVEIEALTPEESAQAIQEARARDAERSEL